MRRGVRGVPSRLFACVIAAALSTGAAQAADPTGLDDAAKSPLCCGVPPRDEVTADQVFGRWVVREGNIGSRLRRGAIVEFQRDGTLVTDRGPCRFAILRAELTITCADKQQTGEVRFVDDTKLIWRLDGKETTLIAPAD